MDGLEEALVLEEEMVRAPRTIDGILSDIHQATSEEQIRRLERELLGRVQNQFGLEDEEAVTLTEELVKKARKQ